MVAMLATDNATAARAAFWRTLDVLSFVFGRRLFSQAIQEDSWNDQGAHPLEHDDDGKTC
jgi:hypothetical protein